MISPSLTPVARGGIAVAILLAVVITLRLGEPLFVPPVIALLLASVLWPGARWLHQRLHLAWSTSCLTVVGGLILLNIVVTLAFALSIPRILQKIPNPRDPIGQQELYNKLREKVAQINEAWVRDNPEYWPDQAHESRVFIYVQDTVQQHLADVLLKVAYYGNSWIWQWVIIMFILLFLLMEGPMLSRRFVEVFGPAPDVQSVVVAALSDMSHQVRSFIVWRTLVNIILGGVVGLFYYTLGLQEYLTWALLTAVLCYVPYLGPLIAGVPPVLDAFISCPSPWYAVGVVVFYIGVVTLEGYVIVPVVMGRSMEMNATTVMLACLFWELIWGLPGLFMAMPLMAAIKAICYHMPDMRPWANLMSLGKPGADTDEPTFEPQPPPQEKVLANRLLTWGLSAVLAVAIIYYLFAVL